MKSNIILDKYYEIFDTIQTSDELEVLSHPSLMGGLAGIALFYSYDYIVFRREISYNKLENILIKIMYQLTRNMNNYSFSSGIAGVGWLVRHLIKQELLDDSLKDLLDILDTKVIAYTKAELENGKFDYLHAGLGGFLHFNFQHEHINQYDDFVNSLLKTSLRCGDTLYWKGNMSSIRVKIEDTVNMGMSHGLPGILVIIANVYKLNPSKELYDVMKMITNMFSKIEYNSSQSIFPYSYNEAISQSSYDNVRLAWCYGDLGISIAMWQAGEIMNDKLIKDNAVRICLHTTKRKKLAETGVVDAGLCHGSSGIAHIYNRMHVYTGIEEFKEAANYWIEETIKMAQFEGGVAGFKSWHNGWENDYSFLEGIAGIGMVLLSHIKDEEPTWDRVLLLS